MKIALVTGGNRGIGLATCEALAQEGIKVILGSRDVELGIAAAEQLQKRGLDVSPISLDVSKQSSIESAADQIVQIYGRIDILINNAAVLPQGSLTEISDRELVQGFQVNLMGAIYCIRSFVPQMIKKKYGRIVNVSSEWGSFANKLGGPSVYSVSKAALNAVTLTASQTLPKYIKINSVSPGWVQTRMGGKEARLLPSEGAKGIVYYATLDEQGPTGGFYGELKEIPW